MSSASKLAYEKPSIEFWSTEALDSIEATMSGGGGGGGVTYYYIVVLNNPSFGLGLAGHSAILFYKSNNPRCTLYSFSPRDNNTNNSRGAVAWIAKSNDGASFAAFCKACKTYNSDSKKIGVTIKNGFTAWPEPFKRYIKLTLKDYGAYASMLERADALWTKPPVYRVLKYNCQSFVNEVLAQGGVTLLTDVYASLSNDIIPNEVFENARHARGVYSFEKQGSM